MLKSANATSKTLQVAPKQDQTSVQVIKNGHTAQELAESGERWATRTGPYLTLDEVLAIEAAT